jgi:hypothetical protein
MVEGRMRTIISVKKPVPVGVLQECYRIVMGVLHGCYRSVPSSIGANFGSMERISRE